MSRHLCPFCGTPTTYQMFSGGREWWCEACETNGLYPDDPTVGPRARLLSQGPDGVAELRRQMDDEIARRTADGKETT